MKLNIGDNAPNFKGVDQNGNSVALSNFKGKNLIMYFYPKDNTPGCTAEACNLRDSYDSLLKKGFTVIGVGKDFANARNAEIEEYILELA